MSIESIRIILFSVLLILVYSANAETEQVAHSPKHLRNAMAFVEVLSVESRYRENQALVEKRLEQRLQELQVDESAPYFARVQTFKASINAMMTDAFDWPQDQQAIARAYANHFNEEELIQVLAFLQSPAYQSYLRSNAIFQSEFQNIGERRNQEVSKKFAQIYADLHADLLASTQ